MPLLKNRILLLGRIQGLRREREGSRH